MKLKFYNVFLFCSLFLLHNITFAQCLSDAVLTSSGSNPIPGSADCIVFLQVKYTFKEPRPSQIITTLYYGSTEDSRTLNITSSTSNPLIVNFSIRVPCGTAITADAQGFDAAASSCSPPIPLNLSALPVVFSKFDVEAQQYGNLINWETSSEINTTYFAIERSYNLIDWDVIAYEPAKNFSNAKMSYNVFDSKVKASAYYKIKAIDENKSEMETNFLYVKRTSNESDVIATYPNPTADFVTIELGKLNDTDATISICDVYGKEVYRNNSIADFAKLAIDLSNFSGNFFVVKLSSNEGDFTKKIFKIQ